MKIEQFKKQARAHLHRLESLVKLNMLEDGMTSEDCQRVGFINTLYEIDRLINGTEQSDLEYNSIPIEDCEFSVRTYGKLKSMNIHTLDDLTQYTEDYLLKTPGIGPKLLGEIKDTLKRYGEDFSK